jgi:hypothetical protein
VTVNPIQQMSEAQASKSQPVNGFSKFHNEISNKVFDPVKYGAAVSKKLQAILNEGALEHAEFSTDLREFIQESMVLVALAGIAVGHKAISPKDDVAVLLQLESLVITAAKFIPLIEKCYAAAEGVHPPTPEVPIEVKDNVTAIEEDSTSTEETEDSIGRTEADATATTGIPETTSNTGSTKQFNPTPARKFNGS